MPRLVIFFGNRILMSIVLIIVVPSIAFVLQVLTPGNVAQQILGEAATPAEIQRVEEQYGLNRPLPVRYFEWFRDLLHGSLGTSYLTGQKVSVVLEQRVPVTLGLAALALAVAIVVGLGLGVASGVRKGSGEAWSNALSVAGIAVPSFVLGLLLINIFAVNLGWFPASGYVQPSEDPGQWLRSLVLPVAAIATAMITSIAKLTRDQMKSTLSAPFIRSLQGRGLHPGSVLFKHALRNSLIPVVTAIGLNAITLIGGTVLVEQIFALPGVGLALFEGVTQHDLPVTLGCALYFTLGVVIINFVTDASYALLDPRLRGGGR